MLRAPQWHGATQTHFPPRPCKYAWRCDITNTISPHGLPTHWKQSYHTIPPFIPLTSATPRLHQHASRSPAARRHANALSTKAAHAKALSPRPRKYAWHCDITDVISPHRLSIDARIWIPPSIPLTSDTPRLHQHVSRSPVARRHANALPTKTSQIRMALRHHERNSPHGLPSPRTVSAEGCACQTQNAISPAFRALDTHDCRTRLRGTNPKRNLTCISRPRHARLPQMVAFRGAPAAPPPP